MKRSLKLALIPTAIAAALTANQAFAGSEACFEVYSVTGDAVVKEHAVNYNLAACGARGDITGTADTVLETLDVTSIAYELTGDYTADLQTINADDDDLHVVYIPTSDIPSGAVIEFQLTNAVWDGNGNQLHLVQSDGTTYELVASSDGTFDGTNKVKFVTKAGVTIGAGTRLAVTQNNAIDGTDATVVGNAALIESPQLKIENDACPTEKSVSIDAVRVQTDGGTALVIEGGITTETTNLIDIMPQFVMFDAFSAPNYATGSTTVIEVQVDAEETGGDTPRTRFVDDNNDNVVDMRQTVVYPFLMIDRFATLDDYVVLDSDDDFDISVATDGTPGDTVTVGLYNTWINGSDADAKPINPVDLNGAVAGTNIAPATDHSTKVTIPADAVFTTGNAAAGTLGDDSDIDGDSFYTAIGDGDATSLAIQDNAWYLTLENADDGVMNFNYTIEAEYELDFDNADYIDHCVATEDLFQVGVNGAVLKVPYTFDANTNWVRITNEHSESALITLDVFDESSNYKNGIEIGTIDPKSSVVLFADALLDTAVTAGYTTTDSRHTMTFTVTAPKDTVHGVSVQKIPGGVDRVLPVLDQNEWRQ